MSASAREEEDTTEDTEDTEVEMTRGRRERVKERRSPNRRPFPSAKRTSLPRRAWGVALRAIVGFGGSETASP